ncbi:MAG: serine/threonine-protein kinase [Legionellaceae bacterium]|nr:serine/threonine-protein kinase [Legionellaceae bacterium]
MHSFFKIFDESKAKPDVLPRVSEDEVIFSHILDRGSFGEVYFGSWNGEPVAIKKIKNKARIEKEAEITLHGSLSHPHIVRALARYNSPHPDNDVCLILEYMNGKDLLYYLVAPEQKTMLSLNMRITITQNIIDALIYLHQTMQILHRDIKPDNILLDHHMRAKLCDFGLSTTIEKAKNLPPCGTQEYSAPELLKSTNPHHTEQTDIYAMGATVFAMITLTQPNKRHTIDLVETMMATVEAVPFKTAKAFKNMVDNSMACKPEHRMSLADMSKLIRAIAQLSERHGVPDESKTEVVEISEEREIEASYGCTVS